MKIYPEKLSKILKDKGVTQRELAEGIGVTETTISRYMSLVYDPTKSAIINISNFLQVPVSDFAESIPVKKVSKNIKNSQYQETEKLDADLRIIQRARTNMSYDERKKMMQILKLTFEDAFKDIEE